MTDLHVHILPGVDDGSPNLSTSLEMAEMAAQSGVRILAVTPHANQTGIEGVEDGYVNYESEQFRRAILPSGEGNQQRTHSHQPGARYGNHEHRTAGGKNQREKADTAP